MFGKSLLESSAVNEKLSQDMQHQLRSFAEPGGGNEMFPIWFQEQP